MINRINDELYSQKEFGNIIVLPVNIVKELIENSIDSGAKQIIIKVEDYGWGKITVADDGIGIDKSDVSKLCQYQATSKIKSKYDIIGVTMLGFRGLALHTISTSSKLDIVSAQVGGTPFSFSTFNRQVEINPITADSFTQSLIEADINLLDSDNCSTLEEDFDSADIELLSSADGVMKQPLSDTEQQDSSHGTVVSVSKIFYYNPEIRQNHDDQLCLVGINRCVSDFILTNGDKCIKYYVDNKLIFNHDGSGRKNAIKSVYGEKFFSNVLKTDWFYHGITIHGYISKPGFGQSHNGMQTISVNNRLIESPLLLNAINDVYRYYLIDKHAFFVLNITLMPKDVDVNTSANKTHVEFANKQRVREAVKESVKKTLQYDHIINERAVFGDDALKDKKAHRNLNNHLSALRLRSGLPFNSFKNTKEQEVTKYLGYGGMDANLLYANHGHIRASGDRYYQLDENTNADFLSIITMLNGMRASKLTSFPLFSSGKLLGMIFDRYILLERDEFLYIIDYYAARARAYYDFYLEQCKSNVVSIKLKEPFVFKVNDTMQDYLVLNHALFAKLGIYFKQLQGVYYRLDRLPLGFSTVMHVESFVESLLTNSYNYGSAENIITAENMGRLMCRYLELRAEDLTVPEIRTFLKTIDRTKFHTSPEGKSIVVIYHQVEFERRFNRKT
ncbi:MAG: ATP-binding protein [Clostridia bacterium]|nr:ATP-binding protein [Clostridia bacterium]